MSYSSRGWSIFGSLFTIFCLNISMQAEEKVVAIINGQKVYDKDLQHVIQSMPSAQVALSDSNKSMIQREVLSMLIDDILMDQFLNRYVPGVDDKEVNAKIVELATALKAKGKSMAEYYKDSNQTEDDLKRNLKRILQWSAYAKKHVTDDQLRKYYEAYTDFFNRVVVRASHIALKAPVEVTKEKESQLVSQLRSIREEISQGKATFADAAKKHSQCPSASEGGDIGTFPRKYIVDENFARTAFSMKPGQISDVVKTNYGYHLIQVTDRKPGKASKFESIKSEVREHYMEDLRTNVLNQLRKSAKIELQMD